MYRIIWVLLDIQRQKQIHLDSVYTGKNRIIKYIRVTYLDDQILKFIFKLDDCCTIETFTKL